MLARFSKCCAGSIERKHRIPPPLPLRREKSRDDETLEVKVEVNTPPSLWTYNLLAMAHAANKETEKAKADFRKILELDPQSAFAKKQLEQLNSGDPK